MFNNKQWCICLLILLCLALVLLGAVTAVVDPYFHYHRPLDSLQYPINNQRYQNDGIVRNFSYDAMITGTSMTENFKASQFDSLFDANTIKVSYSGGTFDEIFSTVEKAAASNPELKTVLFGLDIWFLLEGRDLLEASGEFPTYLYDDNPFNDVQYLLNKEILLTDTLGVLEHTRNGNPTTSFDEYGSWNSLYTYDQTLMLQNYERPALSETVKPFTSEAQANLQDILETRIIKLAKENPQIQFLYFFPPYSILEFDRVIREGRFQRQIDAFRMASEALVEIDNIQLYAFYTDYETITDLNNYRDTVHYSGQINSLILERIQKEEFRLTQDNCQAYWQEIEAFYRSYDYEGLLLGTG